MGISRRPTITDVAAEAGVAASTVSRAFGRPGRVNAHTRRQILEIAERLGYVPSTGRAIGADRTGTVALLVPDITNPFFSGIIKGAERAAGAAGRTLVLGDTQESRAVEAKLLTRLGPDVDGFILAAPRLPDGDVTRTAGRNRVVLINRAVPGVACVVADYESGTRQLVDHLASFGHRELVFLAGPAESWSGARRWAGLRAAAETRGLVATRLGPYSPTLDGGPAAADAAIASRASAIVCHNDMLAIGVLRRLAQRGVDVPAQVSVVGFDDIFGADFCHPPLTTLAERTQEAGAAAIEVLLNPPNAATVVAPTELKIRASSAHAAPPVNHE